MESYKFALKTVENVYIKLAKQNEAMKLKLSREWRKKTSNWLLLSTMFGILGMPVVNMARGHITRTGKSPI